MAVKLGKKGSFDEMMDIILGSGLLVVGIFFLMASMGQFGRDIDKGFEEIASLDVKNDLLTILDTPLESLDFGNKGLGKLIDFGLNEKSSIIDFLYIMTKFDNYNDLGAVNRIDLETHKDFFRINEEIHSLFKVYNQGSFYRYYLLRLTLTSSAGNKRYYGYGAYYNKYDGNFYSASDYLSSNPEFKDITDELSRSYCEDWKEYKEVYGKADLKTMNFDGVIDIELRGCKFDLSEARNE